MDTGTDSTKRPKGQDARPWEAWMSCGPSGPAAAGCCGTDPDKTAEGWRCGAVLKDHKFAILALLSGIGITFLIGFTGCILGIIAFFRTL